MKAEHDIQVSVICNTYNQESYIADAIESFLMQKTNFQFEILVHDDASTDSTPNIIRQYKEKYPDIIKPILQSENQLSKRVKISYTIQVPRAQGKYLAFCEGDDYWTDEQKLQKQFDYMEAHPDCYVCAHGAYLAQAETKKIIGTKVIKSPKQRYDLRDAIQGYGRSVATASMFMRRDTLISPPAFAFTAPCGDFIWPILGAEKGYLAYLPDIMCCYRVRAKNSYSQRWAQDPQKLFRYYQRYEIMLDQLNDYFSNSFSEEIEQERTRIWYTYNLSIGNKKILKEQRYRQYYRTLPRKRRIASFVKFYLPFLAPIYRKLSGK